MSRQIYEEAIADVMRVKEAAESAATRAVLDVVTPRIKELIESRLLSEDSSESEDDSASSAVSPPDSEGKVTLDLDTLSGDSGGGDDKKDESYELNNESSDRLAKLLNREKLLDEAVKTVCDETVLFESASDRVAGLESFGEKISTLISRVRDTYEQLQCSESISDDVKVLYEERLERCNEILNKLRERNMKNSQKRSISEADVTLKLTGLPDDVDLDSVGVDLISDEGEDELGAGTEDAGDAGGEEDLDLGDLGSEEEVPGEEEMPEGLNLSDDTIVEIDENMLRREIARMRALREAKDNVNSGGHGVGKKEMDDFGGGCDDGDPVLDHEPTTAGRVGEPLGEADEDDTDDLDELDELDMVEDDMVQLGNRRKKDELGDGVADSHESMNKHESYKNAFAHERRLQERIKNRLGELKVEHASALKSRDRATASSISKRYSALKNRLAESTAKSDKFKRLIERSSRPVGRSNSDNKRLAETVANDLRAKLAKVSLDNAKLKYANKLLQNESLTSRQKMSVVEKLDAATSLREAKLVYESVQQAVTSSDRRTVTDRKSPVVGSSSRVVKPTSSVSAEPINEGIETDRWARLAGLSPSSR